LQVLLLMAKMLGAVSIHADDANMTGTKYFVDKVVKDRRKEPQVGSEDTNGVFVVGRRATWVDG
jgi:hypothetical protein